MKIWLSSMVRSKLCLTSMVRSKICEAGRGLLSIMVVRENGLRNMVKRNSLASLTGSFRHAPRPCAARPEIGLQATITERSGPGPVLLAHL